VGPVIVVVLALALSSCVGTAEYDYASRSCYFTNGIGVPRVALPTADCGARY
jgi:hypothetical protein